MILPAIAAVMLLTAPGPAEPSDTATPVDARWAQAWQDDLRYLAWKLPQVHADPFARLGREAFDRRMNDLLGRVPRLDHARIVVELLRG